MTMKLIDSRKVRPAVLFALKRLVGPDFPKYVSAVGAAIAGSAVVGLAGSAMSASAAGSAANAQEQGQMYSAQTQLEMFGEQAALQAPWRAAGITALDQLSSLTSPYSNFFPSFGSQTTAPGAPGTGTSVPNMYSANASAVGGPFGNSIPSGFNPGYGPGQVKPTPQPVGNQNNGGYTNYNGMMIPNSLLQGAGLGQTPMLSQIGNPAGGSVGGGAGRTNAVGPQAMAQPTSVAVGPKTNTSTPAGQKNIQPIPIGNQQPLYQPTAPGTANPQTGVVSPFSYNPASVMNDPSYQFQAGQGIKAIQAAAAAKGQTYSPATAAAIGQQVAGTAAGFEQQDFSQALQGFNTNWNDTLQSKQFMLDSLQSLAQVGQTSTNTLTSAAGAAGGNIANTQIAAGNAASAGMIGQQNAINSGMNSVSNSMGQYAMWNAMQPSSAPAASAGGGKG